MQPKGDAVTPLERGGFVIETSEGRIQFGAPPETIKDTMTLEGGVPTLFLVPKKLFYLDRGISTAELEFPLYFNFFVKQQRVIVMCAPRQKTRLTKVMKESVFGPESIDNRLEFIGGERNYRYPDLKSEMEHFRKNPFKGFRRLELGDMATFRTFDGSGHIEYGNLRITSKKGHFVIEDKGRVIAELPENIEVRPLEEPYPPSSQSFEPPLFGVTAIGSGHGFLPSARTSGFILWINRRGILVDPPVDSTEWLRNNEINTRLVDSLILTHCHADHDAGTMQKILEEGVIDLYTTRTILGSFLRKSSALTNLREAYLANLFNYEPVIIGEPLRIHGAEFHFRYSLHSIPTIGFEVYFQGRSMVYSSDTLNDPPTIDKMCDDGIMGPGRRDELINFPWHHDLVIHEAGVPPIHTKLDYLAALPEVQRRNLYVIHSDPEKVAEVEGVKPVWPGIDRSLVLEVNPNPYSEAIEILNLLASTDLFQGFSADKAGEFLNIARPRTIRAGERVIASGEAGEYFYLILAGKAAVVLDGKEVKIYGYNDYFGESALVTDLPRTADVYAKTEMRVVAISKHDFLYFIRGTEIGLMLRNLFVNRALQTWTVLEESKTFKTLTPTQKTHLLSMLTTNRASAGEVLLEKGQKPHYAFIIVDGEAVVGDDGQTVATLRRGDFVGKVRAFRKRWVMPFSITAKSDMELLAVEMDSLVDFLERNPGFYLRLASLDYSTFV